MIHIVNHYRIEDVDPAVNIETTYKTDEDLPELSINHKVMVKSH